MSSAALYSVLTSDVPRLNAATGHYARVGGISLVELNMLEKEFLNIIDWRLTVSRKSTLR